MNHVELKFRLSESGVARLERALSGAAELWVFDRQHPVAYAHTTYLDTDDGHFLHATGGVTTRLRLRRYAAARALGQPPAWTGVCYLERKHRRGDRRQKQRWRLPQAAAHAALLALGRGSDPLRILTQLGPVPTWSTELRRATLQPRLCTWYRRTTYRVASARVTIDRELAFSEALDPRLPIVDAGPPRGQSAIHRISGCIVEVKCDGPEVPALVEAALADLGAMKLRVSKYEMAVAQARRYGLAVPLQRAIG